MSDVIVKSNLDLAVMQIGPACIPAGMRMHPCPYHGSFLAHIEDTDPRCPLCTQVIDKPDGTTASEITPVKDGKIDLVVNL